MFGGLDLRVGRVLNEVAKGSAMTETMDARARLLQSRETTVLAHLEAEKNRDLDATLATFKAGVARLELPGGEIADGPDEVAATYRALFSAFPDLSAPDLDPSSLCHRGNLVIGETRLQGTHMRRVSPLGWWDFGAEADRVREGLGVSLRVLGWA